MIWLVQLCPGIPVIIRKRHELEKRAECIHGKNIGTKLRAPMEALMRKGLRLSSTLTRPRGTTLQLIVFRKNPGGADCGAAEFQTAHWCSM